MCIYVYESLKDKIIIRKDQTVKMKREWEERNHEEKNEKHIQQIHMYWHCEAYILLYKPSPELHNQPLYPTSPFQSELL